MRRLRQVLVAAYTVATLAVLGLNVTTRLDLYYQRGYRDGLAYAVDPPAPPDEPAMGLSVIWLWDSDRGEPSCLPPEVEPRACSGRAHP